MNYSFRLLSLEVHVTNFKKNLTFEHHFSRLTMALVDILKY